MDLTEFFEARAIDELTCWMVSKGCPASISVSCLSVGNVNKRRYGFSGDGVEWSCRLSDGSVAKGWMSLEDFGVLVEEMPGR